MEVATYLPSARIKVEAQQTFPALSILLLPWQMLSGKDFCHLCVREHWASQQFAGFTLKSNVSECTCKF